MTVRNSVHRCIRLLRLRQRITVSCPATHLVRHGNAAISVDHCSLAHDAERGARHNEIDPLTVVEPAHAVDAGDEWQLGGGRIVGSRRPAARQIGQGRGGHRNADLAFLRHRLLELAIHGRRAELPNDCGFHRARAGFQVLAELAQTTQVLSFTRHRIWSAEHARLHVCAISNRNCPIRPECSPDPPASWGASAPIPASAACGCWKKVGRLERWVRMGRSSPPPRTSPAGPVAGQ
jgi:hypothetical protein